MIILEGYACIYMFGLMFNQLVGGIDMSKGIVLFESKKDFKRSFIPFYYCYKWYKKLPE